MEVDTSRDESGAVVSRRTVNNSLGGGSQDNIQARIPGEDHARIMSVTRGANAAAAIDTVIHNAGSKRAFILVFPDEQEKFASLKRRNPRRLNVSRGHVMGSVSGKEAEKYGPVITGGVTKVPCGNCGKFDHELAICVRPGKDGTIFGCPVCNSGSHSVDTCWRWANSSTKTKFTLLVENRARMVPIHTEADQHWFEIYEQHRSSEPSTLPDEFPLTKEYGQACRSDEDMMRQWETFYESRDRTILPVDNKTRDLASVRRLFSGAIYQAATQRDTAKEQDAADFQKEMENWEADIQGPDPTSVPLPETNKEDEIDWEGDLRPTK
ncbi:hypothetical protein PLIIFM63780_003380 [Purpureocillium lilacinum]|nr:hypothetical protein PLIIFM63780_003380 [Purpureocillium lilacinum]